MGVARQAGILRTSGRFVVGPGACVSTPDRWVVVCVMTFVEWLGEIELPPAYWLELDADLVVLHRPDGSVVAAFSAMGAEPAEVAAEASTDADREGKRPSRRRGER